MIALLGSILFAGLVNTIVQQVAQIAANRQEFTTDDSFLNTDRTKRVRSGETMTELFNFCSQTVGMRYNGKNCLTYSHVKIESHKLYYIVVNRQRYATDDYTDFS